MRNPIFLSRSRHRCQRLDFESNRGSPKTRPSNGCQMLNMHVDAVVTVKPNGPILVRLGHLVSEVGQAARSPAKPAQGYPSRGNWGSRPITRLQKHTR